MTKINKQLHTIDAQIGKNIYYYRQESDISQQALGVCIGESAKQIQKYEANIIQIPASHLWGIAHALSLPVYRLFDCAPSPYERLLRQTEHIVLLSLFEQIGTDKQKILLSLLESELNIQK